MKTRYDAKVDALYVEFHSPASGAAENSVLNEDIIADYGPDGRLCGLEILDASEVLGGALEKLLLRANLSGADLSGTNLSGADLSQANLMGATLLGSDLSGANLSGADLSRANLKGAKLNRADLGESKLSGADLSDAHLERANLSGADLSRANLKGASFSEATLKAADLTEALCVDEVRSLGRACLLQVKGLTQDQLAWARSYKGAITE